MSDINSVVLIGRLGQDPDFKTLQTGTPVATFSLAVARTWMKDKQKKEETSWIPCVVWGSTAESVSQYCKKGDRVAVLGRIQVRPYESEGKKRTATEVVAISVQFLQNKRTTTEEEEVPAWDDTRPPF
jgi:single-strand DNA-binding protein